MKNITLAQLLLKKEIVHWFRMRALFNEMDSIGAKLVTYPIIVAIITVFHYCFAGMHSLFEITMYFINREQFRLNMRNLYAKSDKVLKSFLKPIAVC